LNVSELKEIVRDEIKLSHMTKPQENKKISHANMTEMMNSNYMPCPGGNCGHEKLRADNFTKEFKTCPGCNANTNHVENKFCSTCGAEHDKDDWQDSDVELED